MVANAVLSAVASSGTAWALALGLLQAMQPMTTDVSLGTAVNRCCGTPEERTSGGCGIVIH